MVRDHDTLGAAYQRLFRPHLDNRADYYPPKIRVDELSTKDEFRDRESKGGMRVTVYLRS